MCVQTMVTLLIDNIEPQRQTEIPVNCHSRKSYKRVKIADSSQSGLSEPRRSPRETRPTKRLINEC